VTGPGSLPSISLANQGTTTTRLAESIPEVSAAQLSSVSTLARLATPRAAPSPSLAGWDFDTMLPAHLGAWLHVPTSKRGSAP